MNRATHGLEALTEKEKATLRLIVRGHDAKSVARELGLSVHTINERLRDTRRKLAVASSREAARLLFEAEGGTPENAGDTRFGAALPAATGDDGGAPASGAGSPWRRPRTLIGAAVMILALALAAFALDPPAAPPPPVVTEAQRPVVDAARAFLMLIDQSRWDDSYRLTAAKFRATNTLKVWAGASEQVRAQFGPTVSRTFLSEEDVPTSPHGGELVKFRTTFAKKADAIEKVSLVFEDGGWRVAGVYVE